MPNIIPPLLSSTPPPIEDDEEEDEFGDFRAGVDLSFGCDGLSLPPTPEHIQKAILPEGPLDFNSNNEDEFKIDDRGLEKDFKDIRKNVVNHYDTSDDSVSENNKQIENQVDDVISVEFTNDVRIENNLIVSSEVNHLKEENVASSSNATINVNSLPNANNGIDVSNLDEMGLCSNEITVKDLLENDVNLSEDVKSDSSNTDYIEEIPSTSESNPLEADFNRLEDLKENVESSDQITKSDFGEINCLEKSYSLDDSENKQNLHEQKDQDDFGDFSTPVKSLNSWSAPVNDNKLDDDNFGEFEKCSTNDEFCSFESSPINLNSKETVNNSQADNLENDDFGDFENFSIQMNTKSSLVPSEAAKSDDDDFGDFEKFPVKTAAQDDDEEFGDFGSFSTVQQTEIDESLRSGKKAEQIITSAFPKIDLETDEFVGTDNSEKNQVFDLLKDIMETNALKFQWVNSHSQKVLLKSLNIDIRNILYGPGWNVTVPKFAANLGTNPLEPLKPEVLTPEVIPMKSAQPSTSTEVPSAEFDWTSAGLTNPLDYSQTMLLDIEQFVAAFDTNSCSPTSHNSNSSLWDIWLETTQNDDQQPSSGSINLDWNFLEPTKADDWIQKESSVSPAHSLNFEVNHDSLSLKSDGELDSQENFHESVLEEVARRDVLSNMVPLRETHICEEKEQENNTEDSFGEFHMSLPVVKDESEFGDFKSNVTPQLECLQPIPAEPLKPVVVHPTATTVQIPAKIEWPAPGLTEDDIDTIELTYATQPQTEIKQEKLPETSKILPKKPSVEDDDWTDFISHKETKSSPEKMQNNLQLSVFNLGNIQPIKPPVPVITPQGLIQTKLSSTGTVSPLIGSPVHSHRSPQKQLTVKPPDDYQPSIISQQFSKQFFDNTNPNPVVANSSVSLSNYNLHPTFGLADSLFVPNVKQNTNPCGNDDDDDDWTDFVSSQPVQQQQQQQSLSFTPNIIANPNRYDPLREYRLNGDVLNNSGSRKVLQKSSVPSVATLPDLDFVIGKNRTFSKK